MTYYTDKVSLIRDSKKNIDLFRVIKGKIVRYNFDNKTKKKTEENVTNKAHIEYDVYIDKNDVKYLIYQEKSLDLILNIFKGGKVQRIKVTEKPVGEVYYLNLTVIDEVVHIFYFVLTSGLEKRYRIYHHYYEEDKWIRNIVDDIKIRELLNPMAIQKVEDEILLAYYDYDDTDQIFINRFNLKSKSWQGKIKLTDDNYYKLYLDLLYYNGKLHLVYSKYEGGNLQIQYERYGYVNKDIKREYNMDISNYEDTQNPTLIYYDNRLWITWIEKDRVLSRYSEDDGTNWSPIYLWKKSRTSNIVRYKYSSAMGNDEVLLNYSFGKYSMDLSFIGFGPLRDTEIVPLKKKRFLKFPDDLPRMNI